MYKKFDPPLPPNTEHTIALDSQLHSGVIQVLADVHIRHWERRDDVLVVVGSSPISEIQVSQPRKTRRKGKGA